MARFFIVLGALILASSMTLGDELKGKLKDVDIFKKTITVSAAGKDTTVPVDENAKITTTGKGKNPGSDVVGGFLGLKAGGEVTVTTEKKDGKDVAVAIKVTPDATKKKK